MERKELLILILVLLLILVIGYAVYAKIYGVTSLPGVEAPATDYSKDKVPVPLGKPVPTAQDGTTSSTPLNESTLDTLDKEIQQLQTEELTDTDLLVE